MGALEDRRDDDSAPGHRLGRPIVWTAALVYAGSWLGGTGPFPTEVFVAALCAGAIGALAFQFLPARHGRTASRIALALLLMSAAALRSARPILECSAIGRWSAVGSYGDDDIGQLASTRERFVVPAGAIADGELVAIDPAVEAVVPARGPIPGPNAERGLSPPRLARADQIVRLAPFDKTLASPLAGALAALRRVCVDRSLALSDPLTGSLVAALLFGETRTLPDDVPDLFVRTGTFHVLAISGLQVALVAMLIVWPLGSLLSALVRVLSLRRIELEPLAPRFLMLAVFVPLAGAGAPVVRSAIAWGLAALAPRVRARRAFAEDAALGPIAMGRRANPLAVWSLALILECVAHPASAATLSVQLSYAATLGLIAGTSPILDMARRMLPGGGRIASTDSLGNARSPFVRIPLQYAIDGAITALAASAAAVLATLPFTWSRFGEWSPIGIVATALLVIPVLWMLVVGWAWIALPVLVPECALDVPAHASVRMLELLDRAPGSPDLLPHRPAWLVLVAVALTFAWLAARRRDSQQEREKEHEAQRATPTTTAATRGAAAAAWIALLVPWTAAPRGLELWALDVGSGTAVIWRAPGAGAWVFDAGSRDRPDVAREAVLPLLREWEVSRLSIVLSHADRDHDGALPYIAQRVPPTVWIGALPAHCAERLPHTTARFDVGIGAACVRSPPTARGGLSVSIERGLTRDDNEGSRLVRLEWGDEEIVLTGDAEAEGLRAWLCTQSRGRVQRLLLLPHHGSDSELLGPLLAATKPAEVWVSGSAECPVQAELDRRGLDWRWTARDGPLQLELDTLRLRRIE